MTIISTLTLTLGSIIGVGTGIVLLLSLVHGIRGKGIYCHGECHYHPECSYHYLIRLKQISKILYRKIKGLMLSIIYGKKHI